MCTRIHSLPLGPTTNIATSSAQTIFREHQVGPADTLVRRPWPDSLQIQHDSRAILTERPHDHPPRYFASTWTIQAPDPRCIRHWPFARARCDVVVADSHHWHSRHRTGFAGGCRRAVSQWCHQARAVLACRHHQGLPTRNVYLTHARCLAALDAWLVVRSQRRWGLSGADEYRGFRPGSKLVMTHKGQAFELAFKHRQLDSGPEVYRACDSLQQTISRLYRQAGIKQGSSHSGRRSSWGTPA